MSGHHKPYCHFKGAIEERKSAVGCGLISLRSRPQLICNDLNRVRHLNIQSSKILTLFIYWLTDECHDIVDKSYLYVFTHFICLFHSLASFNVSNIPGTSTMLGAVLLCITVPRTVTSKTTLNSPVAGLASGNHLPTIKVVLSTPVLPLIESKE